MSASVGSTAPCAVINASNSEVARAVWRLSFIASASVVNCGVGCEDDVAPFVFNGAKKSSAWSLVEGFITFVKWSISLPDRSAGYEQLSDTASDLLSLSNPSQARTCRLAYCLEQLMIWAK